MNYSLTQENISPKDYKNYYLGNWVAQCSVRDNKGQHCPDDPVHYFEYKGKRVGLCKRCFINYQNGAFQYERVKRMAREDRLYIAQQTKVQICPSCKGIADDNCTDECKINNCAICKGTGKL